MDDNRRRMSGTEQREIHALFAAITLLKDECVARTTGARCAMGGAITR